MIDAANVLPVFTKMMRSSAFKIVRCSMSSVPTAAYLDVQEVTERVTNVVKSIRSAPPTVDAGAYFVADLGFDSLIRKELNEKLADEFCVTVPAKDSELFISVASAIQYFSTHPKAR